MYSPDLERLIQSVIGDGVITDKERAVLYKRAQAEGVDIDELDVYIDGLAAQMKPAVPKGPAKQGIVTKCPNCGAVVEAGAVKCEECGYVFRGVEANSSSQRLAEILAKIDDDFNNKKDSVAEAFLQTNAAKQYRAKVTAVQSFPVPTTKEDLLEFIITMQSRYKNQQEGIVDPLKKAYKAKYDECMTKAKLMFANDPQFQPLFANQLKAGAPGCLGIFLAILGFLAMLGLKG